jgi:hypothetical protein
MNEFHNASARPVGPKTKDWKTRAAEQAYNDATLGGEEK